MFFISGMLLKGIVEPQHLPFFSLLPGSWCIALSPALAHIYCPKQHKPKTLIQSILDEKSTFSFVS
jgi:hypothetical protein